MKWKEMKSKDNFSIITKNVYFIMLVFEILFFDFIILDLI